MAEKDMTEKTLEAYNDVFADIINVLLFHGEQVIKEDELEAETARSIYKADGKLHEQEHDTAKFWKGCNIYIALLGLKNQTRIDADMPLRIIGYDGAAYRSQLLADQKGKKTRFPVVTLVLYFGFEKHWDKGKSLYECLKVPEKLKPYVSDYKMNLFEIAYLEEEQVKLFQSDFRFVADYFVQMRKNRDYVASAEMINHIHEVFELMGVLTKDSRFMDAANESLKKGGPKTMCDVLDRAEAKGEARERLKNARIMISFGERRGISNVELKEILLELGYNENEADQLLEEHKTKKK